MIENIEKQIISHEPINGTVLNNSDQNNLSNETSEQPIRPMEDDDYWSILFYRWRDDEFEKKHYGNNELDEESDD